MDELRRATASSHAGLERALESSGLLSGPPGGALLERFYGFHAAWEPAMAAGLGDDALFEPRRRLALLEADLHDLGRTPAELARLPRCIAAAGLAAAPHGSLYVLEGATLGGQVIRRRLHARGTPCPRYFNPYGAATGAMWSALKARLRGATTMEGRAAMTAAAVATFELLHDWLRPVLGEAHDRAA
ncbi:MAG: biliverdin-producing heme oxygenase [Alphaproteobacteria bacterium]|nr:biliverdin-producing heme oxygenase [Alphaproteobacteria bacterium]